MAGEKRCDQYAEFGGIEENAAKIRCYTKSPFVPTLLSGNEYKSVYSTPDPFVLTLLYFCVI